MVSPALVMAQTKIRLSIVTGGTGGVYYPYGGGMAAVLSKHLARGRSHGRSYRRLG